MLIIPHIFYNAIRITANTIRHVTYNHLLIKLIYVICLFSERKQSDSILMNFYYHYYSTVNNVIVVFYLNALKLS